MNKATRRHVLKGLGLVGAGVALEAGPGRTMMSVAFGYTPKPDTRDRDGLVFSRQALAILHDICARTIPTTDTPGAHELDVHGFIDNQLYHCFDARAREAAVLLLERIELAAVEAHRRGFAECHDEAQIELLTRLERGAEGFDAEQREVFKYLKNLIVFGYLTTEVGGTRVLAYDPFPGGFRGSVPYASVGRAWLGNVS